MSGLHTPRAEPFGFQGRKFGRTLEEVTRPGERLRLQTNGVCTLIVRYDSDGPRDTVIGVSQVLTDAEQARELFEEAKGALDADEG